MYNGVGFFFRLGYSPARPRRFRLVVTLVYSQAASRRLSAVGRVWKDAAPSELKKDEERKRIFSWREIME